MKSVSTPEFPSGLTESDATSNVATLSLEQLAQLSGVGTADLNGLVDYGVLTPATPVSDPWKFPLDCVMTLQRADRLRQDLALDDRGFAMAVMLMTQIADFEDELRKVTSRQPSIASRFRPSSNRSIDGKSFCAYRP